MSSADRNDPGARSASPWSWLQLASSGGAAVLIAVGAGLFVLHKHSMPTDAARPALPVSAESSEEQSLGVREATPEEAAAILAQVKQLYASGTALAEQGKLDAAMDRFAEAVDRCPSFAPAHGNLGAALYQKGQIREALQHLLLAVQLDPKLADAHFTLGLIHMAQEDYPKAAADFAEVVRLRADDADAHCNLALALDRQGKVAEAVPHYREVVRLNPANLQVARQLAWYLATWPDAKVRNADEAVSLAERVVQEAGSRVPMLLDTLAAAYANSGRFDDAVRVAQNAIADAKDLWKTVLAQKIESRLKLYQAKLPYREERK